MEIKLKQKEKNKISKGDIKNNKHTHLKFNYSFTTSNSKFSFENKEFNDAHKLKFLERVLCLSQKEFIEIMTYPKDTGFELIKKCDLKDIDYNIKFEDVEYRKSHIYGKYCIIRLYPNNNPLPSRIIGMLINNVFYILYIDLKHKMYKG